MGKSPIGLLCGARSPRGRSIGVISYCVCGGWNIGGRLAESLLRFSFMGSKGPKEGELAVSFLAAARDKLNQRMQHPLWRRRVSFAALDGHGAAAAALFLAAASCVQPIVGSMRDNMAPSRPLGAAMFTLH
ncbi:hypothetical protein PG999_000176 [Apiospora kogelbergensis]|uniref:Uncharacterized protein n=1 Tax=Apiospora kogelbergensis TaxID=1337665 RepID=A0AAW0RAZ9_9PEZI